MKINPMFQPMDYEQKSLSIFQFSSSVVPNAIDPDNRTVNWCHRASSRGGSSSPGYSFFNEISEGGGSPPVERLGAFARLLWEGGRSVLVGGGGGADCSLDCLGHTTILGIPVEA